MSNKIYCIELELSNGEIIEFYNYPLDEPFNCTLRETKVVADDLITILEAPQNDPTVHPGNDKIFIGFSSDDPSDTYRFPLWFPTNLLTKHICIAGAIDSGKTSLSYRLIAGALKSFGTVVIGEAKGGNKGFAEGAGFTNLAKYLVKQLSITAYRWPRGNCWFNPLSALGNRNERREFLNSIVQCLSLDGEYEMFGDKIIDIVLYLLDFLYLKPQYEVTLRQLVKFLDSVNGSTIFQDEFCNKAKKVLEDQDNSLNVDNVCQELKEIHNSLTSLDYFRFGDPEYIATRNAMSRLANILKSEDLLHYTERHKYGLDNQLLVELTIDDILANRSLVVISQPIADPTSKIIGTIFWDTLYAQILNKGVYNQNSRREKVLAIFDETDDLPTGKLGESGGFIRQYGVGLVDIMPSIRNEERWNRLNQVYQTFISLTPALLPMTRFIHNMLPPEEKYSPFHPEISFGESGSLKVNLNFDRSYLQPVETPGISSRFLNDTGKRTALLMLKNPTRIFWVDLESPLLGKFDYLLQDAVSEKARPEAVRVVDYALGLSTHFP